MIVNNVPMKGKLIVNFEYDLTSEIEELWMYVLSKHYGMLWIMKYLSESRHFKNFALLSNTFLLSYC